jgi:hypothetical protein
MKTRENVDITARVRRSYDAYSRGDYDTAMEWVHPEIELVPAGGQPPIRGAAAYRAWMEPDAFASQMIEPLEIRLNARKILIQQRSTIRGAGSGFEADFLTWSVLTVDEEGRTMRHEIYLDHEQARAFRAAGLSE